MRTNIVIDDDLMEAAMEVGGYRTKRQTVEAALELFVRDRKLAAGYRQAQEEMRRFRGQVEWDGDLDALRRDK